MNGRDRSSDLNLCDVCYWRKRAEARRYEVRIGTFSGYEPMRVMPDGAKVSLGRCRTEEACNLKVFEDAGIVVRDIEWDFDKGEAV